MGSSSSSPAKSTAIVLPYIGATKEEGGANLLGIAIQIVLGLICLYVIYLIALVAIKSDQLYIDDKFNVNKKSKVLVIDGYADSSQFSQDQGFINTSAMQMTNYIPINPSVNLRGGAQFTYTTWFYLGTTTEDVANKCIFVKGDKERYQYSITNHHTGHVKNVVDRVSFCPMLYTGPNLMDFDVYFNTINNVKEVFEVRRLESTNTTLRHNLLSLFGDKWVMITFTFEDNIPINDFENGIVVKFWVNDTLYQTGYYTSALKQNNGNLYFFPDGTIPTCRLCNFSYMNYCASLNEIQTLFMKGPSNKPAVPITKSFISPSFISDYNRLDVYNT